MNRSFRVNHQQQHQMVKDKEDDLALFLEMRKREKERNDLLLNNGEEFDAPLGSKPGISPIFSITSAIPPRKTIADEFLNSDGDKNDYDWLLTPPGTPLFPSLEIESQKTLMSQLGSPKALRTVLKSRLANALVEPATARTTVVTRQPISSPGHDASGGVSRRPSSGGPGSRPATPTLRPTITTSKPSRSSTPTARPTLSSIKHTTTSSKPSVTKPTVSSTRPTSSITKPSPTSRSTTPSRSTPRSSTPTARSMVPPPKPISRSVTPTHRPSTPTSTPGISARPTKASSVSKPSASASKNPVPSRGTSPTVKSRPWKPSEMPGYSLDAPPNLRTTLPERPRSATRGRPGSISAHSSSVEPGPTGKPRRQSCSPSRGRLANGGSSVPVVSRGHTKINDNVSPVVLGTKMVERVINTRKLVPPKQDEKHSPQSNLSGKSATSPDSSGFGRTLSKKSLDMAMRHMDIRRSIQGNLRPFFTNIPASLMYSVRTGPTRSRTGSVTDSPLATSSNASSEVSVNNNGICVEVNEFLFEDGVSERDNHSPGGR